MAELLVDKDEEGDEEEQELQVMRDEDDDEGGVASNHTLKLSPTTVTIQSEIFCLAFSADGR